MAATMTDTVEKRARVAPPRVAEVAGGQRVVDEFDTLPSKISVRNLDFFYGKDQALFGNSVEIKENRVTAIIGPSGCGKSTHIRTYNRIYELYREHKASGEVWFDGQNVLAPGTDLLDLRRRIGMIFQKPSPFPMTVFDNIAYGLKLHFKLSKSELSDRVEDALRHAALWDEVKHKLKEPGLALSGGQQQRLCIARAIAAEPEVILMDEPASAIDPVATAKIEELMEQLKSEYTIVIVTHNMQQAARVSDYTAFFYEGYLVEFGPTTQIFENPRERQTEDYITGRFS
jgi:phosphate transport system ATP-binding protein